jgi:hypothetical protein
MMTVKFCRSLHAEKLVNDQKLSLLKWLHIGGHVTLVGKREKSILLMTLLTTMIIECWWLINEI